MTKERALELAMGVSRPANLLESQFRDQFRKPNAMLGTGFPGLTEEEFKRAEAAATS